MLKALIIEDEKPAARRLQRMVEENNLEVVDLLHSVSQSITWFENHQAPDLIFLDIQLSDGISFEIFEKIKIHTPIIFTTAYDSYTLKAFKLNSIDYLLKPIDPDELKQSIQKFQNQNPASTNQNHVLSLEIQKIKELLNQNKTYKERFTVYVGSLIKLLEVQDIECIISVEKATYAYTFQGKSFLLEGSLESVCTRFSKYSIAEIEATFSATASITNRLTEIPSSCATSRSCSCNDLGKRKLNALILSPHV